MSGTVDLAKVWSVLKEVTQALLVSGTLFVVGYYRKRIVRWFRSLREVLDLIPSIQNTINDMDTRGNKRACEMRMVFKMLRAILHAIQTGEKNGNITAAQNELDAYLTENLS